MIPYKWKFWKRKKPKATAKPAKLTVAVAITDYDEFMGKVQKMEQAIEALGAACDRAGEGFSDICERVEITYNYHITTTKVDDI